jgi:hypothetical protein
MQFKIRESCFVLFLALQLIPIVKFYSQSFDFDNRWSFESLDERFSWRMFSPLSRTLECRFEFLANNSSSNNNNTIQRVDLSSLYQKAWLDNLALCRQSVAAAIIDDLCKRDNSTRYIEQRVSIRLKLSSFKVGWLI